MEGKCNSLLNGMVQNPVFLKMRHRDKTPGLASLYSFAVVGRLTNN